MCQAGQAGLIGFNGSDFKNWQSHSVYRADIGLVETMNFGDYFTL
jgi:hypothetical protein